MAHSGQRQQNALAPNRQVGELRGGGVSRLGLDLMESRRRPSWRRGVTAEPRTVHDVSSRCLVKQERTREIVIGRASEGQEDGDHGEW